MSLDCKAGLAFKLRDKIPTRQKVSIFQKILENPDLAAWGVTFISTRTQHLPAKGQHNLKAPWDHTLAHTSSFLSSEPTNIYTLNVKVFMGLVTKS